MLSSSVRSEAHEWDENIEEQGDILLRKYYSTKHFLVTWNDLGLIFWGSNDLSVLINELDIALIALT